MSRGLSGLRDFLDSALPFSSLGLVPGSIMQSNFALKHSPSLIWLVNCFKCDCLLGCCCRPWLRILSFRRLHPGKCCMLRWAAAKWYPTFRLSFKSGRRLVPLARACLVPPWSTIGSEMATICCRSILRSGAIRALFSQLHLDCAPVNQVNTVLPRSSSPLFHWCRTQKLNCAGCFSLQPGHRRRCFPADAWPCRCD